MKVNFDWNKEQAWDDYVEATKKYEDVLRLYHKCKKLMAEMVEEETKKYNDILSRLAPLIKDKIMEKLDLDYGKASEELREMARVSDD